MIRPPFDGWIDERAGRQVRGGEQVEIASVEQALRSLAQFRGEVLAAAYLLESARDRLSLWHFFRNRQDGMAAFFEDMVLHENGFGLERKVRLAHAIIDYWQDEEVDAAGNKRRLDRARGVRNQVAHWPGRLVPVFRGTELLSYDITLVKDGRVTPLDSSARQQLLDGFTEATNQLESLSEQLADFARREDG